MQRISFHARRARRAPLTFMLTAGALALAPSPGHTQSGDYVVTATRTPTPSGQVGSSVTVITAQDLARRQTAFVSDILREVPGVTVNRSGGIGTFTEVRIRGAEANQVLVLIDGIKVLDPAAGEQFDFGTLTADQIDRIEVIRGAHSTIYGSEAIGGVIQIFTKKGRRGLHVSGGTEAGSYDWRKVYGNVSGGGKTYDFAVGGSFVNTDGISIADKRLGFSEPDLYRNGTFTSQARVRPADWLELSGVFRYAKTWNEADTGFVPGFNFADDDAESWTTQYFGKSQAKMTLLGGKWEQYFRYTFARTLRNSTTPANIESFTATSNRDTFGTQSVLRPFKGHVLTFGFDRDVDHSRFTNGSGQLQRDLVVNGYYAQYQASVFKRLHLTGGVRFDDNKFFGLQDSYRLGAVFDIKETKTKLKASYGTGFKSPTIGELFFTNATFRIRGNPNLSPEFARTRDFGIEQSLWRGKALLGVTYFESDIYDLIQNQGIVGGFLQPQNVGRANTHGIEVAGRLRPFEGLSITASYTWLVAQDKATGSELLRRPKHTASVNFNYVPPQLDKLNINLGVNYRGTSRDISFASFPSQTVGLPSAIVVNLAVSYAVTKEVTVFGRIENLNNAKYETIYGAGTPGRTFFAGVKANLSILD
jgi:vitamin B12 transporter